MVKMNPDLKKHTDVLDKWPKSEWPKFYSMLKDNIWPYCLGEPPARFCKDGPILMSGDLMSYIEDVIGEKTIKRYMMSDMAADQFEDWWDSYVFKSIMNQLKNMNLKGTLVIENDPIRTKSHDI